LSFQFLEINVVPTIFREVKSYTGKLI
jgi:hypothetical protein